MRDRGVVRVRCNACGFGWDEDESATEEDRKRNSRMGAIHVTQASHAEGRDHVLVRGGKS